ncbi:hypothetical protein HOP51_02150 [Halomonas sp. MCCC 1A11036]|uniref:Heparin-sulfate lyase N-terminal domain-containing protein n=1 Tax=Billgrantia zhangzhouensis TaxID=2733481 RepID=A0ABS9AAM4_9GAMM|nr:heparinase II/III family protein [Halomonas zhangzhouensis]MCE8018924.1 hypothetical protein [Halomonas zhangzhouensis]
MNNLTIKSGSSPELECCVQKKLQQLSNNSSNCTLGERLFVKQQLELAPFKAVKFSGWGDWEQDPLNNRSWQWRLNWLSFLSYLIAYHRSTGDGAVLDFAREAIQSWLDTYLKTDTSYPFEFIWHDHATALRAEQLVLFLYYCHEYAPEWVKRHCAFLAYLKRSLVIHGQWLSKDSFYSEHTNHGLEQARVLLLLGTVLEGSLACKWQQVAVRRISSELTFSFTDEGVHVENSPAYHVFVFKVFLGIIKDYPDEVLGGLAKQFDQFSAKALSFITHILRPDGRLPPIGDTEQLPTSDAYGDMFGHTLEYQYFLYAMSQGKQGLVPPALNRVYANSGYAIFRDQWPSKEHYRKAFHLIAKVGCSSRYHHQQDEGHISLYAGGEDWLIDSGLYNYINKDPVRKYMRGRPGHNVPMISHANYAKEFEHRLSAWQVVEHSETAPTPYLTMKLGVLLPVKHVRRVDFDTETKVVRVEDKISSDDHQQRNITLHWHFPKDKRILIEGNQVIVTSPTGNRLRINFEGEIPDNLSVVKGRKEERVFSCVSYKANQVEPSQLLRVMFKERMGLQVATRFDFDLADEQIAPPAGRGKTSVKPLATLLASLQKNKSVHSAILGSHSAYLALARMHRNQGLGHVSLLVDESEEYSVTQEELSKHNLIDRVTCYPLTIPNTVQEDFNSAALQEVKEVDLLIITGTGFSEKRLTAVLLITLPELLKRMNNSGEVWVSNSLPEPLRALCETWSTRTDLRVTVVTGLDEIVTTSQSFTKSRRLINVLKNLMSGK